MKQSFQHPADIGASKTQITCSNLLEAYAWNFFSEWNLMLKTVAFSSFSRDQTAWLMGLNLEPELMIREILIPKNKMHPPSFVWK